jgi:peroxiredoxin Q/BCP
MRHHAKTAIGLGIALAGVALAFAWPVVGVLVSFAGVQRAVRGAADFSVPLTRGLALLSGLGHAFTVLTYSGSAWLAAATLWLPLVFPPRPVVVRHLGYGGTWTVPAGVAACAATALLDWPPRLEWWAVAPALLYTAYLSIRAVDLKRHMLGQLRPRWQLAVGDVVPDFELPTRGGGRFRLSEHRGRFVFIHFMRSDWCPLCQVMLRVLENAAPELERHNAKIVVVSPSDGAEADAFMRDMGLDFVMAVDPTSELSKRFGAFDPESYDGKGSPLPVGFLVGPDGALRHASKPTDVRSFLDPDEVLRIVAAA